jgi:hypothetical protein
VFRGEEIEGGSGLTRSPRGGKGGGLVPATIGGRGAPARKRRSASDRGFQMGLGVPTCGLVATVPQFNLIQTGQTWFKPI